MSHSFFKKIDDIESSVYYTLLTRVCQPISRYVPWWLYEGIGFVSFIFKKSIPTQIPTQVAHLPWFLMSHLSRETPTPREWTLFQRAKTGIDDSVREIVHLNPQKIAIHKAINAVIGLFLTRHQSVFPEFVKLLNSSQNISSIALPIVRAIAVIPPKLIVAMQVATVAAIVLDIILTAYDHAWAARVNQIIETIVHGRLVILSLNQASSVPKGVILAVISLLIEKIFERDIVLKFLRKKETDPTPPLLEFVQESISELKPPESLADIALGFANQTWLSLFLNFKGLIAFPFMFLCKENNTLFFSSLIVIYNNYFDKPYKIDTISRLLQEIDESETAIQLTNCQRHIISAIREGEISPMHFERLTEKIKIQKSQQNYNWDNQ